MGNNELKNLQLQYKGMIEQFISKGMLEEANQLINEYGKVNNIENDTQIYTFKGVIKFAEGDMDNAEAIFEKGLEIDSNHFELLYNLAFVKKTKNNLSEAVHYYSRALEFANESNIREEITNTIKEITTSPLYPPEVEILNKRAKIVFFSIPRGDSFLDDIITHFSKTHEVLKIIVSNLSQIEEGMRWADICWFEWCDNVVITASQMPLARTKKMICRIHSYEVFTENPKHVKWENIDKLIIVTDHLKEFLKIRVSDIESKVDIRTINNGVNMREFDYLPREKGFNIAFVGFMKTTKNPMLLLQIAQKLIRLDSRYNFFIAGEFKDEILEYYWDYMIIEMGLSDNVHFEGYQTNMNEWLKDKNYIISTTMHESFGYGIAEAMTQGVKPVIHNFFFSKEIWPKEYLYNNVDEAIELITNDEYSSQEYHQFIKDRYSLERQMKDLSLVIEELETKTDIYDVRYKNKSVRMYLPNPNEHIQNLIIQTGEFYEVEMLDYLHNKGLERKVVIDVGANIGNHSLFFSIIGNAEEVHSFEPSPRTHNVLEMNMRLNKCLDNVKLYNCALGSKYGHGKLEIIDETNWGMNQIHNSNDGEIEIFTLDEIFANREGKIDVLKIDVEGMGKDVLIGSLIVIERDKPDIFIEAESRSELLEIKTLLEPYSYEIIGKFNHTPTYFLKSIV